MTTDPQTPVPTPEEWAQTIRSERDRQVEMGYSTEHDDVHGLAHLLRWAIDYSRRGKAVESSALVAAALDLIERRPAAAPTLQDLAVGWLTLWWDERTWYPFTESESADITGPGHQDPAVFVAAVCAYDKACGGPGDDPNQHHVNDVGHRWALFEGDPDEPSLRLVPEGTPGAVPVTTIWGIR